MNLDHRRGKRMFFPLFIIAVVALTSLIVQLLWNKVVVPAFSLPLLSYWQAMGLLILCRILFGGFKGGSPMGRPPFRGGPSYREKWMHMSDEERRKFKSEWRKRCGREPEDVKQEDREA